MATRRGSAAAAALVALVGIACDKKDETVTPAAAASGDAASVVTSVDAAPATATPHSAGLATVDNDVTLVALATKARACPWNERDGTYDDTCPAWLAWRKAEVAEAAEPTLVNLLDDPDVKVRALGANRLAYHTAIAWNHDKTLARRVIAAAAHEAPGKEMGSLGAALARIDFAGTGTWPAAKAALTSSANPALLFRAVSALVEHNENDRDVWEFEKEATHHPDAAIAAAAVHAFASAKTQKTDACGVWTNLLGESDALASAAASELGDGLHKCAPALDTVLDTVSAREDKGVVDPFAWADALDVLGKNSEASADEKQRAATILAKMAADPTNGVAMRNAASKALKDLATAGVKPAKAH